MSWAALNQPWDAAHLHRCLACTLLCEWLATAFKVRRCQQRAQEDSTARTNTKYTEDLLVSLVPLYVPSASLIRSQLLSGGTGALSVAACERALCVGLSKTLYTRLGAPERVGKVIRITLRAWSVGVLRDVRWLVDACGCETRGSFATTHRPRCSTHCGSGLPKLRNVSVMVWQSRTWRTIAIQAGP
jgi:hypothetical protein